MRNALVSEVVERYFGLALAMQVVDVRRRVVDGVRRHLADAEALERDGMIAQSERLYVEFKLADAERELSDAQLQMQTIAAALNNTLGRNDMWRRFDGDVSARWARIAGLFSGELALGTESFAAASRFEIPVGRGGRQGAAGRFSAAGGGSRRSTFCNYRVSGLLPRWAVGVGVRIKIFDGLEP